MMNSIQSILVIVDPTVQVQPAVAKGALLAQKLSARLDLFVCDTQAAKHARLAQQLLVSPRAPPEQLGPWLDSIAAPLRERGLEVTTEVLSADPLHTALLDRVKHTCAGLVIKDTHHHTAAQRTFLTNTDWELIRGCPVPLLLVKPAPWSAAHRIGAASTPVTWMTSRDCWIAAFWMRRPGLRRRSRARCMPSIATFRRP